MVIDGQVTTFFDQPHLVKQVVEIDPKPLSNLFPDAHVVPEPVTESPGYRMGITAAVLALLVAVRGE
jgi:hypothetical protein